MIVFVQLTFKNTMILLYSCVVKNTMISLYSPVIKNTPEYYDCIVQLTFWHIGSDMPYIRS